MKKVAILGYCKNHLEAPFDDPDCEFWGVNYLYNFLKTDRWTRWFEIHRIEATPSGFTRKGSLHYMGKSVDTYLDELNSLNIPVYMQTENRLVKKSLPYPKNEILQQFGRYFTSTISWMIALAIHENFNFIGVYGVDMNTESEYRHQRPCVEYLLGYAKGRGIRIATPNTCGLFRERQLYGFER